MINNYYRLGRLSKSSNNIRFGIQSQYCVLMTKNFIYYGRYYDLALRRSVAAKMRLIFVRWRFSSSASDSAFRFR